MSSHTEEEQKGLAAYFAWARAWSLFLGTGIAAALVWKNADSAGYDAAMEWSPFGHEHWLNAHFVANDVVMPLFFGLAAKEIREAILPGGPLSKWRQSVNPLAGTLGGILGPIGVYFAQVYIFGWHSISNGWGVPTATDIALAWMIAKIIFGPKHPAVSYLLLLAVADDAIGCGIIAIFYPTPDIPVQPIWLLLVVAAACLAFAMRKAKWQSYWPYLLVPGIMSWFGLHEAGLHPALALVPVVIFMPDRGQDKGLFQETKGDHFTDTANRFEHFFKPIVEVGLLLFGLTNTNVLLGSAGPATYAVVVALILGKTIGIFSMSFVMHTAGFKLPKGMSIGNLALAAFLGALGMTVAIFVAAAAFQDVLIQGAAKMGALLTLFVAPVAIQIGRWFKVKQWDEEHPLYAEVEAERAKEKAELAASQAQSI